MFADDTIVLGEKREVFKGKERVLQAIGTLKERCNAAKEEVL